MRDPFYDSREWHEVTERAIERDGNRCLVAWIFGGRCAGALHGHHIIPRAERPDLELDLDNVLTACARHHPMVEALRRAIVARRRPDPWRCPHKHVNAEGRRQCEARRRRELDAAAA